LASLGKLLTATAALVPADEGKLDLDAEITSYLPGYPPNCPGSVPSSSCFPSNRYCRAHDYSDRLLTWRRHPLRSFLYTDLAGTR
jgi:hypothetical protein